MTTSSQDWARRDVPFFRPSIGEDEQAAVLSVLESGWLTTGEVVSRFERAFAERVGAKFAVAVNSATAALHLAVEAMGLRPNQGVLVPTHTFAATAEVVRYMNAVPILVDCDETSLFIDLADAAAKADAARKGVLLPGLGPIDVVGVIPVHFAGVMGNVAGMKAFAAEQGLWIVEDAAHSFPAAWRATEHSPWIRCGENTGNVTCFSFYANKTITTGEGGMAVTNDADVAARIRLMSLHGLSKDAWDRYSGTGSWDYRIINAGFKYNLTDIAAALGLAQLARAEAMRTARERIARSYTTLLAGNPLVASPPDPPNRLHAWHLFPIRLRLDRQTADRDLLIAALGERGVATSVHWRPLHLHPYYSDTFGWLPEQFPTTTRVWKELVSLPLFPSMLSADMEYVVQCVHDCTVGRPGALAREHLRNDNVINAAAER